MRLAASADKPHRRRRSAVRVASASAGTLATSLIVAPSALANFLTPKSGGSPNADQIHSLYVIILILAAIVFVLVEGALVYSVYKFRAKKSKVAAQIHGNTRLEIGWTVGAALILVVITVVTFIKLPSITDPPNSDPAGAVLSASLNAPVPPNGKSLTICVQGRQFIWRYTYGPNCDQNAFSGRLPYSYTEMVAPANTTVKLVIQATDVIHSWWVPSLGGKVDAVPGYTTYTWFKSPHPAVYRGQCAQLCGRQHAAMVAFVKIVSPSDYAAWIQRQSQLISNANTQVTQLRQILTANGSL